MSASVKIFQSNNAPDIENQINKWIKEQMPPDMRIKHSETTSCRGGEAPQEFPIITVSLWYGSIPPGKGK